LAIAVDLDDDVNVPGERGLVSRDHRASDPKILRITDHDEVRIPVSCFYEVARALWAGVVDANNCLDALWNPFDDVEDEMTFVSSTFIRRLVDKRPVLICSPVRFLGWQTAFLTVTLKSR
jgi:hypothetical protein